MGRLDKRHPIRKTALDFLRSRVCNSAQQGLYCCNGEAPTEFQLQDLKKSKNPTKPSEPTKASSEAGQDSGKWKPDGNKEECGLSTTISNIFNGNVTKIGEVTYMALLGYFIADEQRIEYGCGGSIINKYYILTAAHCLNPAQEPK